MHTVGEAKGVKLQGGLLEVITRAIEIECLPDEIPEEFTVDVTELMIGQSQARQRRGACRLDEAGELARNRDRARRWRCAPRKSKPRRRSRRRRTPKPAPPPAEPEVIKKGKKEEEAPAEEKDKGKKEKGKKK